MSEYRVEIVLKKDRTLILNNLPFQAGDKVEVIVKERSAAAVHREHYPLRGKPLRYDMPTEPIAEEDWNVLK